MAELVIPSHPLAGGLHWGQLDKGPGERQSLAVKQPEASFSPISPVLFTLADLWTFNHRENARVGRVTLTLLLRPVYPAGTGCSRGFDLYLKH